MMINPYSGINWQSSDIVKSVSHIHVTTQEKFEQVLEIGLEHIPISHYQPSSPQYPLSDFYTVPEGILGSPNSEKVRTGGGGHLNALGSFAIGNGWEEGAISEPWNKIFDRIFSQLQYEDGGGVTLNHTSDLNFDLRTAMLDYDQRVLGIEIYNNMADIDYGVENYCQNYFVPFWDSILATGRRCWGFGAIDWPDPNYLPWYGANMLIVPERTEHECLKAYRNGSFFVIIKDTGLRFTNITADSSHISCTLNENGTIEFVTQSGIVKTETGISSSYTFEQDDVYCRIQVKQGNDMTTYMYSNPVILKQKTYNDTMRTKKRYMLLKR